MNDCEIPHSAQQYPQKKTAAPEYKTLPKTPNTCMQLHCLFVTLLPWKPEDEKSYL